MYGATQVRGAGVARVATSRMRTPVRRVGPRDASTAGAEARRAAAAAVVRDMLEDPRVHACTVGSALHRSRWRGGALRQRQVPNFMENGERLRAASIAVCSSSRVGPELAALLTK